jgi:hypothetical protein
LEKCLDRLVLVDQAYILACEGSSDVGGVLQLQGLPLEVWPRSQRAAVQRMDLIFGERQKNQDHVDALSVALATACEAHGLYGKKSRLANRQAVKTWIQFWLEFRAAFSGRL